MGCCGRRGLLRLPDGVPSPSGRLQAQEAPANSEAGPKGERHGVARVTCRRRMREGSRLRSSRATQGTRFSFVLVALEQERSVRRADGFIFLPCRRKTEPERSARRLRFQHIRVVKVREWRRAVSTAHPCADETMADIVSATLRAIPPPRAATQGAQTAAGILPS